MIQAVPVKHTALYLVRCMPSTLVAPEFRRFLVEREISRAIVLSGIGSLVWARYLGVVPGAGRPFGPEKLTELSADGPFELLSLEGNIFPSDGEPLVHLHAVLGKSNGEVIGGHLVDGEVYTTIEMLLLAISNCGVDKSADPVAGGKQLRFGRDIPPQLLPRTAHEGRTQRPSVEPPARGDEKTAPSSFGALGASDCSRFIKPRVTSVCYVGDRKYEGGLR